MKKKVPVHFCGIVKLGLCLAVCFAVSCILRTEQNPGSYRAYAGENSEAVQVSVDDIGRFITPGNEYLRYENDKAAQNFAIRKSVTVSSGSTVSVSYNIYDEYGNQLLEANTDGYSGSVNIYEKDRYGACRQWTYYGLDGEVVESYTKDVVYTVEDMGDGRRRIGQKLIPVSGSDNRVEENYVILNPDGTVSEQYYINTYHEYILSWLSL